MQKAIEENRSIIIGKTSGGAICLQQFSKKISTLFFIITFFIFCCLAPFASAAETKDTDTGLPVRTAEEISAMWKTHMNPKADYKNPFAAAPSVQPPYKAGVLNSAYLEDGLRALNFFRFISGLPDDITLDPDLNDLAAHGAVLLAAEGHFAHEPDQPANMPDSFYERGFLSTRTANLYSSYGYDEHILFASIKAYMEDSDVYNLPILGHRRWILNPPLKKTGMGLAENIMEGKYLYSYAVTQVFDTSREEEVDYRYIPYPARGAFPVEVMLPRTAWSVIINPKIYAEPEYSRIKVTLTRQRDNRTWVFGSRRYASSERNRYFNVDTDTYGSGPAIIFRPEGVVQYRPGDVFRVKIEGLKNLDGKNETISYTVNFVSAKDPDAGKPKFGDIAGHWAEEAIKWAAKEGIVSGYGDNTFRPGQTVTEAEFLVMFTRAMGADVTPTERWADAYYEFARQHRLALRGLGDEAARSRAISRTGVAELFASAAGYSLSGDEAIRYMLEHGYSKGKTAATVEGYAGSDSLTRAEAVQFIRNALNVGYKAVF
jgi:hypothetical protein